MLGRAAGREAVEAMRQCPGADVDGPHASLAALDRAVAEAIRRGLPPRFGSASPRERPEAVVPQGCPEGLSRLVTAEIVVGEATERAPRRDPEPKVSVEGLPEAIAPQPVRPRTTSLVRIRRGADP